MTKELLKNAAPAAVESKLSEETSVKHPVDTVDAGNGSEKNVANNSDSEKMKELETLTAVCNEEVERVLEDPRFHADAIAGGTNAYLNITEAIKEGVTMLTPRLNRKHGVDKKRTGQSLIDFGPQHPVIVITKVMADAAGIDLISFSGSEIDNLDDDTALGVLDGNGRIDYLLTLKEEDRPSVYAVFPSKNSKGQYDLRKILEVINTQVTVWKTSDYVFKRILEDGVKAHDGWKKINELVQKGYKFQAACEAMTLDIDRIPKKKINEGAPDEIFSHYESAVKIHEALVKVFGEDDTTLKTKVFPAEISKIWARLQKVSGDSAATDYLVAFINNFPKEESVKINAAKTNKANGTNKDDTRIRILNEQFDIYSQANPFK